MVWVQIKSIYYYYNAGIDFIRQNLTYTYIFWRINAVPALRLEPLKMWSRLQHLYLPSNKDTSSRNEPFIYICFFFNYKKVSNFHPLKVVGRCSGWKYKFKRVEIVYCIYSLHHKCRVWQQRFMRISHFCDNRLAGMSNGSFRTKPANNTEQREELSSPECTLWTREKAWEKDIMPTWNGLVIVRGSSLVPDKLIVVCFAVTSAWNLLLLITMPTHFGFSFSCARTITHPQYTFKHPYHISMISGIFENTRL